MKTNFCVILLFLSLSFYGQNDTLAIIKHTERDIVFPKEQKVVYRGIPNYLSIEVPNCRSFTATGTGLTAISKNNYSLTPGPGLEAEITIEIVLKSNKKLTEKHVLKIKNTSGYVHTINQRSNDSNGIVRMHKEQLNKAVVRTRFEDKNLIFAYDVASFEVKIPGNASIEVTGNKIDDTAYKHILKTALGNQILICNIRYKFVPERSGMCFLTPPLVIELY